MSSADKGPSIGHPDKTQTGRASGGASQSNGRLLAAAVVVGVIFVVLLNLQGILERKRQRDSQVEVVLVTSDLQAGAVLSSTNMRPLAVPAAVIETASGLERFSDITPGVTVVKRPVAKNDLLRLVDLVEPITSDDTLNQRLRGDRRVISLAVDRREPSAFIRSGSRVDIYGVPQGGAGTMLIIENLEVLSIDGKVDLEGSRQSFRSIETHVPSELVERIKEVQRRCSEPLSLSVRRPGDTTMTYPYDPNRPEQGGTLSKDVQELLIKPYLPAGRGPSTRLEPGEY